MIASSLWILFFGGVVVLAGVVVGLFFGVRALLDVEDGLFLGEFGESVAGLLLSPVATALIPCSALKLCMTK